MFGAGDLKNDSTMIPWNVEWNTCAREARTEITEFTFEACEFLNRFVHEF